MRYMDSVNDFFRSPRWLANLFFTGVCMLIPVVGPMVVGGWLYGGFWGRTDNRAETFPDFDFNRFVTYLQRGLWPFLVILVVNLVTVPVSWMLMASLMMGVGASAGSPAPFALLVLPVMGLLVVMSVAVAFLGRPLALRAANSQDFGPAFDFKWCWDFVRLTWAECILATLFLWVASVVMALAGMLAFCIGVYFITGPLLFAAVHLDKSIYGLFVARGGSPLATSPKLRDDPPPLPSLPLA